MKEYHIFLRRPPECDLLLGLEHEYPICVPGTPPIADLFLASLSYSLYIAGASGIVIAAEIDGDSLKAGCPIIPDRSGLVLSAEVTGIASEKEIELSSALVVRAKLDWEGSSYISGESALVFSSGMETILVRHRLLLEADPYTLGEMDDKPLSELDYIIIAE